MRHTRGQSRSRRSHHSLESVRTGLCSDCKMPKIRHAVCLNCGKYRGKQIIDVQAEIDKKAKKKKEKQKSKV
ncbi:MAG: 50S ribosomal protein L32 [bacterium]|nr:50S ribosomal protein L32 [bacterium]